jgi:alpha-ketoglutarate-dependent taurine dioxygenase
MLPLVNETPARTPRSRAPRSAQGPFDPDAEDAYRAWRAAKLRAYPTSVAELVVPVRDPRALTAAEHAALARRIRRANMAVYASAATAADKELPRALARQFGLERLDSHWLADDDGVSSITVADGGGGRGRGDFIPYTNRPIRWHTDGYYNPPQRRIRAMVLHCVAPAASGGENALLDHELAYLLLRDADPAYIRALMRADAMTIPARTDEDGVARPAQTGPVFSVNPDDGTLHLRYTARTRSIEWNDHPEVRSAVAFLEHVLGSPAPYVFRLTLAPGMGVICNNVLHERTGFSDDPARPRLLYRARYYDRIVAGAD